MKKFVSGIIIGGMVMTSISALAATTTNLSDTSYTNSSNNVIDVSGEPTDLPVYTGSNNVIDVSGEPTDLPVYTGSNNTSNVSGEPTDLPAYTGSNNASNVSGEPTDLPATSSGTTTPTVTPVVTAPTYSIGNGTWNGKTLISKATAQQAAIKTVGGGSVIWSEADVYEYDDLPTYDFKILKNNRIYEIEINALTGTVKDFELDD